MNFAEFKKTHSSLYPFEANYIGIDNYQMHYIDVGPKDAPVVLMIHGNPTWSYAYRNIIKDLSHDHRCIAIDHIGCGFSDRVDTFLRMSDRINHLEEFIEKMDLNEINLLAHDWGGAISLGTVLKLKNRFKSINLFNTGAFISSDIPKRIALCRIPILGSFMNRRLNLFLEAANIMASKKGLTKLEKDGYRYPYSKYENRKAIDDFVHDIPLKKNHPTYETLSEIGDQLKSIDLPKQLIWGKRDFCFHMAFHDKFMQYWPEAKSIVIENAGHYVFDDSLDECIKSLREFI